MLAIWITGLLELIQLLLATQSEDFLKMIFGQVWHSMTLLIKGLIKRRGHKS